MEKNEMTPAVPATETKPEAKHITKEQLDELKKQGIELTPEEVKHLESLMASGVKVDKLSDGELSVSGGGGIEIPKMSNKMKIALGVLTASVVGVGFGAYKYGDKITGLFKSKPATPEANANGENKPGAEAPKADATPAAPAAPAVEQPKVEEEKK